MRRIFSILLIILFVFNAGGYYFVYIQLLNNFKYIAQNEVSVQIPLEKLELIKINNNKDYNENEFERVNDEEIRYNGNMYDIYKIENKDDETFFYCVNDENEDVILKAFTEFISDKKDDKSNSAVKNIIKIFISQAISPQVYELIHYNSKNNITTTNNHFLLKTNLEIPSPPPKA